MLLWEGRHPFFPGRPGQDGFGLVLYANVALQARSRECKAALKQLKASGGWMSPVRRSRVLRSASGRQKPLFDELEGKYAGGK